HSRVYAAGHIRDGNRIAHRTAIRLASKAHQSGLRLRENVVAGASSFWSREAVSGDAAIDQSWKLRAQCLRIEAALLQRSKRRLIADKHIRRGHETQQRIQIPRLVIIQCDGTLVPVCGEKISGFAGDK